MRIGTVLRRGIAARRARTVATGIAVTAAVAFLSGTYVLTDSIDAAVRHSAGQATGRACAIVTDARGLGDSLLAGTPTLPPDVVTRVRHVRGVTAAEGIVAGYAMPLDRSGHGVASTGGIGISVPADARLRLLSLHSGHWPKAADQVVVDATTASGLGLAPGRSLRVALAGGARTFTVSGTVGLGDAGTVAGLTVVGFDPAAVFAGLLAAAIPARRAARLDLLTALHTE